MAFEIAVQSVVYSILSADTAVGDLVTGVFDAVPQGQDYPYISIGESTHNAWDTYNTLGDDASVTIHTWSRSRGRKETKEIQGAIYDALQRADGSYSGYDIISIDWQVSQSFLDADGLTRHGVSTLEFY